MVISTQAEKHLGHPAGNIIVWMSLIIGQPLAGKHLKTFRFKIFKEIFESQVQLCYFPVLMYYHDFVVEHYGKNLLESFGTL